MVFDGITAYAVINELNNNIINARVEKVVMPNNSEINIYLYNEKKYILKIDTDPSKNRIHLSNHKEVAPITPPLFCMVLRKHLEGSRILKISQYMLDRIILIDFETRSELNDKEYRTLVIELMGKHSNCILIDSNFKIIDSLKHITPDTSSVRTVLPNMQYIYPITKSDFLNTSKSIFENNITNDKLSQCIGQHLLSTYNGFSKMFLNTILNDYNEPINTVNIDDLYNKLFKIFINLKNNNISYDIDKKYILFNSNEYSKEKFSINYTIDNEYYNQNLQSDILNTKNNLLKIVSDILKKDKKKLDECNSKLKECLKTETYKIYGELITSNIYKYDSKQKEITVENYYDNNNLITIPLDEKLSLNRNAQKYFKKYSKLKTALNFENDRKEKVENEIYYLESILYEIENCNSIEEYENIENELRVQKYIKSQKKQSKTVNDTKDNFIKTSFEGYNIIIGKNNIQNEYLTHKIAKSNDIWLHTQKIPGSHVIIQNTNKDDLPNNVIEYAASLAAYYSKARNNTKAIVDYCSIKYIKKHPIKKPGMVIYTNFNSISVIPTPID